MVLSLSLSPSFHLSLIHLVIEMNQSQDQTDSMGDRDMKRMEIEMTLSSHFQTPL